MSFVKVLAKDFIIGFVYSAGCAAAGIGALIVVDKALKAVEKNKKETNQ